VPVLTYLQAVVIGLLQGVTELFPVSSLGHSVLVPAWIGGNWEQLVVQESSTESPYLAFIVGLHVATALALLVLYRRDWVGIVRGFFSSLANRRVETVYERMAWLIVVATIPVGILGLLLEHSLRTLFAKPLAAGIFLTINGLILLAGERLRRRAPVAVDAFAVDSVAAGGGGGGEGATTVSAEDAGPAETTGSGTGTSIGPHALDVAVTRHVGLRDAGIIGGLQSLALLAGISRSGITMVAGLLRGLTHEEAVRFAFLLATPVIFAAGVYKVPDLFGPLGNGIRGQVLAGSVAAFGAAYASARFLERWFRTRTLYPFAIYCLVVGLASVVRFS
jgi:undecaprenyl-diphosphatase